MKIGIDARLAFETGVGRYIRNLLLELSKIDLENTYVIFCREVDQESIRKLLRKEWKIVPTSVHWHSLNEQTNFAQILTREDLDLMHFPYFSLPILYKKPFVVTIHDLIIHHFPTGKASTLPLPLYQIKRFAFKKVLKHGIQQSEKIIVPLNAVKEDIQQTFGVDESKIVVTYEGVDHAIKKNNDYKPEVTTKKYFLYVGNAYPHKNVEGLIAGFEDYKSRYQTDTQLLLVGKKDYFYSRIKKQISSHIKQSVHFLHNISDHELAGLYHHAQGLVSASFMEGFGLPPLEALAHGCLPVLSDIPSFREVCQDNALYFNPHDPESIASVLHSCDELSESDKSRLLKNGAERVEDFSWKMMTQETLAIYKSCQI